jgi:hypothetical protein
LCHAKPYEHIPQGYVALCLAVKGQAADTAEWVEWHQLLGVQRMYVFDMGTEPPMNQVRGCQAPGRPQAGKTVSSPALHSGAGDAPLAAHMRVEDEGGCHYIIGDAARMSSGSLAFHVWAQHPTVTRIMKRTLVSDPRPF